MALTALMVLQGTLPANIYFLSMSRKCDLLEIGVMSGNNVSHSNRKTKRKFLPNLKDISFKSEVLGSNLKLRVAASTLRTINNKYGNIDSFLINYRFSKLSEKAQILRNRIKKKLIKENKLEDLKNSDSSKKTFKKSPSVRRQKLAKKA